MLIIKTRSKIRKHKNYTNNKKLFEKTSGLGYKDNVEYHDRFRARAKALYRLKTADIPTLRRSRKPTAKGDETSEKSLPKPKGRPKTKGIVNV
jgi:hypothetical protein